MKQRASKNPKASQVESRTELPEGILPNGMLPDGWALTSMASIADIVGGGTPQASDTQNFSDDGYPWITPADLSGFRDLYISRGRRGLSDAGLRSCSAVMMPAGTVLMSSRAPIGYLAIARNPVCTNQGFKSFICHSDIVPELVYYWLKLLGPQLENMGSGSTFLEISGSRAREIPVLLAPSAEQRRIAAKIAKALPRVDSAADRLLRVPLILKRFRQAVLAAAFSGQLTEKWRLAHVGTKVHSGGLPETWRSKELKLVADVIDPNPSHRYPSYQKGTIPILATEQFRGLNDWSTSTAKLVNPAFHAERAAAHGFHKDDIIFARKGRLGLARRPPPLEKYVFSHTLFIIRAHTGMFSDFLLWFLRQDSCVAWLLHEMNANTGVPTLGKSYMESLPVYVPPADEQEEIVRRIVHLFDIARRVEDQARLASSHVRQLTGSILAQAFRGELVTTEAELGRREGRGYEPASVLLERIRVERDNQATAKLVPKRTPRKASAHV